MVSPSSPGLAGDLSCRSTLWGVQGENLNTTNDAVAALANQLRDRIGQQRYDLWFANNTKISWEADVLTVGVQNLFFKDWLQKQFAADLGAAAALVLGRPVEVGFRIDPELFRHQRQHDDKRPKDASRPGAAGPEVPRADAAHPARTTDPARRHVRRRRLADFIVGPSNRVAHAALVSIVDDPGSCPTPLVLHGPVGLGKSHLLEGIHAELREQRPDARILHLTAEDFTNRFLGSIHAGKQTSFRRQFRDCDALLIDDLHFLARKTATQEEFLHTLEALQRDHRPVVVTCDCHPRLAEIFLPELTDRLAGGAVWGLSSPDLETRRRILEAKMGDAIDPATLDFLAEKLRGNVRELEGALHSVRHLARVTDRPITPELAQEALAEVLRASVRTVQLADIEKAVSAVFSLGAGILQSRQRRTQIAYPRMLAMYLARKHTGATYSEVGHHFGRRNHSTVVAAEKKVRLWLTTKESLPIGTSKVAVKDLVDRFESELAR